MAMRRPRIKAAANLCLSAKRKLKTQVEMVTVKKEIILEDPNMVLTNIIPAGTSNKTLKSSASAEVDFPGLEITPVASTVPVESETSVAERSISSDPATPTIPSTEQFSAFDASSPLIQYQDTEHLVKVPTKNEANDNMSFKYPPKVEYQRTPSYVMNTSDADQHILRSDIEDNVIQMDLQRSAYENPATSPSKVQQSRRERIRPTPIFGQRRNSFVASPSPHTSDDLAGSVDFIAPISSRRDRHYSSSYSQSSIPSPAAYHHHYTPHRVIPARVRTESNCSAFSDTYAASVKSRKTEDQNSSKSMRREFEARCANGMPDKSTLKLSDYIYYNPATNPMPLSDSTTVKHDFKADADDPNANEAEVGKAVPVPQLKLDANGEVILDNQSLIIETTAEQEARKVLAKSSVIVVDENTSLSGFYKRHKRTKEWPPEETVKFYRCLQIIGTDFSLMCNLFKDRTRRDLKLKFKKEERINAALIDKAIMYPKTFNIDDLKNQLELEEREREENERQWKEIKAKEPKRTKQRRVNFTSTAARALSNGDEVYLNENIYKRKYSKRAAGNLRKGSTNHNDSENNDSFQDNTTTNQPDNNENDSIHYNNDDNSDEEQSTSKRPCIKVEMDSQLTSLDSALPIITKKFKTEYGVQTIEAPVDDQLELEQNLNELLCTEQPEQQEPQYADDTHDNAMECAPANDEADCNAQYNAETPELTELPHIDEEYLQDILRQLNSGTLTLVSDEAEDGTIAHSLYILNEDTGELADDPLDVPEAVVQCVLSVLSEP